VAASVLKQSDLALSKVRRTAQEQIDTTYAQVLGDIAQVEKEKKSMNIYNRSYQAEAKDYRYGLVTNLEVLLSQDTLQINQRYLDRLNYQFRADYLRLQAMVANRPSLRKVAVKE
jgi:outer membrane protein TolC